MQMYSNINENVDFWEVYVFAATATFAYRQDGHAIRVTVLGSRPVFYSETTIHFEMVFEW